MTPTSWRAVCACAWRGPLRATYADAVRDARRLDAVHPDADQLAGVEQVDDPDPVDELDARRLAALDRVRARRLDVGSHRTYADAGRALRAALSGRTPTPTPTPSDPCHPDVTHDDPTTSVPLTSTPTPRPENLP